MDTPPLTNLQTRDVEALLHPYTPLHTLRTNGPTVMERGKGVFVYDTQGRGYIEGMSGLWCAGLGFGDEELVEAAVEQMRTLPYYHLFGAKGTTPVRYRVSVKAEGDKSTVRILDDRGQAVTDDNAKRILSLLMDDLK